MAYLGKAMLTNATIYNKLREDTIIHSLSTAGNNSQHLADESNTRTDEVLQTKSVLCSLNRRVDMMDRMRMFGMSKVKYMSPMLST